MRRGLPAAQVTEVLGIVCAKGRKVLGRLARLVGASLGAAIVDLHEGTHAARALHRHVRVLARAAKRPLHVAHAVERHVPRQVRMAKLAERFAKMQWH